MVEGGDIGAPDGCVGVDDDAGHEDHAAFFEEVCVFEQGVTHHLTDGGADRVASEDLLECGAQDRAVGLQSCNVETSHQRAVNGIARSHGLGNFPSAVLENCRVGIDVVYHPCDCPDGTGKSAN